MQRWLEAPPSSRLFRPPKTALTRFMNEALNFTTLNHLPIDLDELLCVVIPCVKILHRSLSFKRRLPPAITIAYEDIPERDNQSLHIAWGAQALHFPHS